MKNEHSPGSPKISAPSVTLPKGGGAIQGIGETFHPNAFSGTGSYSIPIHITPARGFEPQLALGYSSGGGNGVFGIGFALSLPKISRRTEKGIPTYDNADIFMLSGTELIPRLVKGKDTWVKDERTETIDSGNWNVSKFLPRVEGSFEDIELWVNLQTQNSYWKITGRDNTISFYGKSDESKIVNPAAPEQVFEWLIEESTETKGNKVVYTYAPENYDNVPDIVYEANRLLDKKNNIPCANKYIQRIQYGNYIDENKLEQFAYEVIFDYGERDLSDTALAKASCNPYSVVSQWDYRQDPFSRYKSGFEIRTYRLCQHILMFHNFKETGEGPCLVRRTSFNYEQSGALSVMASLEVSGYRKNDNGSYEMQKMPPLEFEFSTFQAPANPEFNMLEMGNNVIPGVLDRSQFLPIDLYREGIEGFLYSNDNTTFYLEPLGEGKYTLPQEQEQFPINKNIRGGQVSFADINGNGQLDLVVQKGEDPVAGYYRRENMKEWANFEPFYANPTDVGNLYMEMVSLCGNGRTDLLVVEENELLCYLSIGDEGYKAPLKTTKPKGFPSVKRNYQKELVTFTNILGDGLAHRVCISERGVECWPNLGYGQFGDKIIVGNAPCFGEDFKTSRLFLADVDGSGTTDLVYVYDDRIELYLNQGGNSFADALSVKLPEPYSDNDQIKFADILGNGTSCLVFTKVDTGMRHYFLEFVGENVSKSGFVSAVMKPYLMIGMRNNMGASTSIQYCSSTKFYLEDKKAGNPWITQLPFPVQVVEQTTHYDEITGAHLVNSFKYHDGYYDFDEKEFRGFGYVEAWDTETFKRYEESKANKDFPIARVNAHLYVPPVYTRTWYHTGVCVKAGFISNYYKQQYYRGDADAYHFPDSIFSNEIYTNDPETFRQAYVALKGHVLHAEVYALDESEEAIHPYTVSESNMEVRLVQAINDQSYAVFMVVPRESISYHYERNPSDPRIQQQFALETDAFGHTIKACSISLPRRAGNSEDMVIYPEQLACKALASISAYINNTNGFRLLGVSFESKEYEITGVNPVNGYCTFDTVFLQVNRALQHIVPYGASDVNTTQARQLSCNKGLFWNEAQTDVLPLGQVTSKALVHHHETAVFTKELILAAFTDKLSDDTIQYEGGYFFDPATSYWWNRGLVQYYYTDPACFYLPNLTENSFVDKSSSLYTKTTVEYDIPYYSSAIKLSHWLDEKTCNTETIVVDYVTHSPKQITDSNNNTSQVLFNPLGQVIAGTTFGLKNKKKVGGMSLYAEDKKTPAKYIKRSTTSKKKAIDFTDVLDNPDYYLQGASFYYFYDLFAWMKGTSGNLCTPLCAIGLQRENFYYATKGTTPFSCQVAIVYSDGFNRILETKTKADAGPGLKRDADGMIVYDENKQPVTDELADRWLVSGRTVYNNKGKPCEQYLPYYSSTPHYEDQEDVVDEKLVPPPTVIHYDPLLRVKRSDTPKGFFSKVVFTPWQEMHYDENDTVLDSAFYMDNYTVPGKLNKDEKDALDKAAKCYNTPDIKVLDSMGHAFLQIQDNLGQVYKDAFINALSKATIKPEDVWNGLINKGYLLKQANTQGVWLTQKFQRYIIGMPLLDIQYKDVEISLIDYLRQGCLASYHEHDIQGREIRSVDPRLFYSNISKNTRLYNFRSLFPMGSEHPFYHDSVDAGVELHFSNIFGEQTWSLTPRNFNQLITYDRLQRRVQVRVIGCKDDGTIATDNIVETFVYGESQANPEANNLRGQLYQLKDQSGIITHTQYDLHGALLNTTRQLTQEYKTAINWAQKVPLRADIYQTSYTYDALNRVLSQTTPDGNITLHEYNRAGLLLSISVQDKKKNVQPIITNIEYDAQHQRTKVAYANGSQTTYLYEDTTLRLLQLQTTRNTKDAKGKKRTDILQNITYTHDPHGNITRLYDSSFQTVFNNNQKVEPLSDYTYDALYRLAKAGGRQHPAVVGNIVINNPKNEYFKQGDLPLANDGTKLENYTESYTYDEAGNLLKTVHNASNSWTRETPVSTNSNRLKTYTDGSTKTPTQDLDYDRSGNLKQLSPDSTVNLTWSCCENLVCASLIQRPGGIDDADYYTYDRDKTRIRKVSERMANGGTVTEAEEKVYLGNYEEKTLKTITAKKETSILHRQTLRVMDGESCVAIIHYWVQDTKKKEVDKKGTRKIRYQLNNHLGSAAMELDDAAQLISYEEYFPYGGTAFIAGANQKEVALKEYRYSGKERDDSTGLYYYGARYYAPWLGRWLSPDPAGTVDGFNLFAFVGGNPVNKVDPNGTSAIPFTANLRSSGVALEYEGLPEIIRPSNGNLLAARSQAAHDNKPTSGGFKPNAHINNNKMKGYKAGTIRIHWKGARTGNGTSGIMPNITKRSDINWNKAHENTRSQLSKTLGAKAGFTRLTNGKGFWAAENSHLIAGSLWGPNDALSAPPASVHQNTEWLAIEIGVKALVKAHGQQNVLIKATGYVHDGSEGDGLAGTLKAARYKIYLFNKKVFDHISLGNRGNIDSNESETLKDTVSNLGGHSTTILNGKGVYGNAPSLDEMKKGQSSSAVSPMFTDIVRNGAREANKANALKTVQALHKE